MKLFAPQLLYRQAVCAFASTDAGCNARDDLGIAILPQVLAIEPRFVRKGCVSCRLVGTAPAPAFRKEIEKKERVRGQEGKRAREEDVKM